MVFSSDSVFEFSQDEKDGKSEKKEAIPGVVRKDLKNKSLFHSKEIIASKVLCEGLFLSWPLGRDTETP